MKIHVGDQTLEPEALAALTCQNTVTPCGMPLITIDVTVIPL